MLAKINQISIITSNLPSMLQFYNKVLNFKIKLQLNDYVELENESIRLALSTHNIMHTVTNKKSLLKKSQGQSFLLTFKLNSSQEVDITYQNLVNKGAKPIKSPHDMKWKHRAAFFADPDNNIYEIFAKLN